MVKDPIINIKKLLDPFNGNIIKEHRRKDKLISVVAQVNGQKLIFENQNFSNIPFGVSKTKVLEMVAEFAKKMNLLLFYKNKSVIVYDSSDAGYEFFKGECTDIIPTEEKAYNNKKVFTINELAQHNLLDNFYEVTYEYSAGKHKKSITLQLVKLKCDIKVTKIANIYYINSDYASLINYIVFGKTIQYSINALKSQFLLDKYKNIFEENTNCIDDINQIIRIFNSLKKQEEQEISNYLNNVYRERAIEDLNSRYNGEKEQ